MRINLKGFSTYFSIGDNNGIKIQKDGPSIRINLLWLTFCMGLFDIEKIIQSLLKDITSQENDSNKLKANSTNIDDLKNELKKSNNIIVKHKEIALKTKMELEEEIEQLKQALNKSTNNEALLKDTLEELTDDLDNLNDEVTDLGEINDENNALKEHVEILEKSIKDYEIQMKEYMTKIEELKQQIVILESVIESPSSSSSSIIVSLSSSSSSSL